MCKKAKLFFFLMAMVVLPNACVQDDEFGTPPIDCTNRFGTPTATMAEVLAYNTTGVPDQIPEGTIFTGFVVSSDQAGNFFSSIVLQDALENPTASLQLELDRDDLYLLFPLGQEVVVDASNLFIDNDRGAIKIGATFQLGSSVRVGRIPETNVLQVIEQNCGVAGTPSPVVFNSIISALRPENINKLITINNVKFTDSELGNSYADPDGNGNFETINRTMIGPFGQTLGVRNSGFASFANQTLPEGSGSITGILSAFDFDEEGMPEANEFQFFIRDVDDVQMDAPRFADTELGIGVLRNLEEDELITFNRFAQGIITLSPNNEDNIIARNAIIQDETGGVVLRFDADAHNLNEGDEVRIFLNGLNMDSFAGVKQLEEINANEVVINPANGEEVERVQVLATGQPLPAPQIVSVADVSSGEFESVLVEIQNVQWDMDSQGSTLSGTSFITDCENTIGIFTRTAASFSGSVVPTLNGNLQAIGGQFSGAAQLFLRNTNDFAGMTAPRCQEPIVLFEEDFSSQGTGDINLNGWMNLDQNGNGNLWQGASFSGNQYALGNQFGNTQALNAWLITPAIDLSTTQNEVLTFDYSQNFYNGDVVTVLVSTDYDGVSSSPEDFTWTNITTEANLTENNPTGFFTGFASSNAIDLSGFNNTVYIAFQYKGVSGEVTTRFHLDNITVAGD